MLNPIDAESIKLLTLLIRQHNSFCHSIINEIQNSERLSVSGFDKLDKTRLSIFGISHSATTIDVLLSSDSDFQNRSLYSYEIHQLLDTVSAAVTNILRPFYKPLISCSYRLADENSTVTVDRTAFELIIFNILNYCFRKSNRKCRTEMRVKETKKSFIISIFNTNAPEVPQLFSKAIESLPGIFSTTTDTDSIYLISAQRIAESAMYRLRYKHLKGTNLYSITIPKQVVAVARDAEIYEINRELLLECFADTILHFSKGENHDNPNLCANRS